MGGVRLSLVIKSYSPGEAIAGQLSNEGKLRPAWLSASRRKPLHFTPDAGKIASVSKVRTAFLGHYVPSDITVKDSEGLGSVVSMTAALGIF
jgi:hypothetical protein